MLRYRKVTYCLFLGIALLLNNSYSHVATYAITATSIHPTKEWRIVNNPSNKLFANSGLATAAALSARNIWAVGYVYADDSSGASPISTGLRALIEQWNGDAWHIVTSPIIAGTSYVSLSHMVALSSKNIWAIGGSYTTDYSVTQQLIEHWNGTSWQVIKPPALKGVRYSNLFGITASGPNDIWVVGGYARPEDQGLHHALIEHWNGTSWRVMPAGDTHKLTDSVYEELQGVVAITAKDIWTVGVSLTGNYAHRSLIEHWDSKSWAIVDGSDRLISARSDRTLNAIAARASNDIWIVGQASEGGPMQSLIKHWNGKIWSDVPGPGSSSTTSVADGGNLLDLTILAPNDIWAVGSYSDEPRIEHWNGKIWTIIASPTLSVGTSMLSGIVHAADAHQLWAVGSTNQQGLSEIRADEF